jgi:ATP-dependent 26S proteasome regulatory subunit
MRTATEQIHTALASAYPLIFLVTMEEDRLQRLLQRFADSSRPEPLPLVVWNCADGFEAEGPEGSTDPMQALEWVRTSAGRGLYVFKDLSRLLDDPKVLRRLRDTAMSIRNSGRYLFVMGAGSEVPALLRPISYVVVSLFPDDAEVRLQAERLVAQRDVSKETLERLVTAMKGISLTEVEHLLRRLLDRHDELDEAFFEDVLAEKEQVTRKEGILEFVPPDPRLVQLGGLDQLRGWMRERRELFSRTAREAGLPVPKGVLLMGMSGCGKSLAVKVIAREWQLPLFRLDMNLVFSAVHGSPEWVFHRALEAVESVAPAVLWIDEIEMGVAGYQEGQSGALTRIFSTFLTWMQEHRAEVFVAATANRINLLPAEVIRKGRFDQVFFVDLPSDEERKEILEIHMRRNAIDPSRFDLILLASATRGWNGAEIEQAVISAKITATASEAPLDQTLMLRTFGRTVPLSKTMEEQLKAIRSWARTRALPATSGS